MRFSAVRTRERSLSYAQIGAQLGISAGSIGPRRDRCLDVLRRDPVIGALLNPDTSAMGTELRSSR